MTHLFLAQFYPPSKVQKQINDILQFEQFEDEHLYESWIRYKNLLRKCPQHGIDKEEIYIRFYHGLTRKARKEIDYSSKGGFLANDLEEAKTIIELSVNNDYEDVMDRRLTRRKVFSRDEDAYGDLKAKLARAQNELKIYKKKSLQVSSIYEELNEPIEEVNYVQRNYRQGEFSGNQVYAPNNRNHHHFSYANPNNALQPPTGFNVKN